MSKHESPWTAVSWKHAVMTAVLQSQGWGGGGRVVKFLEKPR